MRLKKILRAARGRISKAKKSREPSVETTLDSSYPTSGREHGLAAQQPLVSSSTNVFNMGELRDLIFLFHAINLLKTRMELVKIPITPMALWRAHSRLWDGECHIRLRDGRPIHRLVVCQRCAHLAWANAPRGPVLPKTYLKALRLAFEQILAAADSGIKHKFRIHDPANRHQEHEQIRWDITCEQDRTLSWLVQGYRVYSERRVACKKEKAVVRTWIIKE